MLLIVTTWVDAAGLGRLFFTPEQRFQLEHPQRAEPHKPPRVTTINGIVQKHGGGRTVWINGVPQYRVNSEEAAVENATLSRPGVSSPASAIAGRAKHINPAAGTGE